MKKDEEPLTPKAKDSGKEEKYAPTGTLYRSRTDKRMSGVCGGLGEYFKIDPTLIRVGWVVVTLMSGFFPGVVIYFLLSILIPETPAIQEDAA